MNIRTDPAVIRRALHVADTSGVRAAERETGVTRKAIYKWRALREQSGGAWPTVADVEAWRTRYATNTVCIRQEASTIPSCRCTVCRPEALRLRKATRCGMIPPARSAEAWARFGGWVDAGWSPAAIADATGLSWKYCVELSSKWRQGYPHKFGRGYSTRVLEADSTPAAGFVSPLGARRRLEALATLGHSLRAVEAVSPDLRNSSTLSYIRGGQTDRITPQIDAAIRAAYKTLCMTPPKPSRGVTQAKAHARRQGWLGPLHWDDIDDVAETGGWQHTRRAHRDPVHVDPNAVTRRMEGDRSVQLNPAERFELVRLWRESGRSLNECERVTGVSTERYKARGDAA